MITGFTIKNVEGKIESAESLSRQRFPRLNVNIEKVDTDHDKINVGFSFVADYFDGMMKPAPGIRGRYSPEAASKKDQERKWDPAGTCSAGKTTATSSPLSS